jgi:glutathione synthase/RimK-type ligase-like ATP-grasp enzyme
MPDHKPINIVLGLPDDAKVRLTRLVPKPDFYHSGTASFLIQLQAARPWRLIWVGPAAPASTALADGPVINYIADPDLCGQALAVASNAARTLDRAWFNHPDQIKKTTRDQISLALQGIPGVDTPKVIRSRPTVLSDVLKDIDAGDLTYPVLVRSAGQHGGQTLVRLDGPSPEQVLATSLGFATDLYITEFRDFADADGLYRRYRFVVVGGKPYIKSILAGRNWNLHAADRVWNDVTIAQERDIIERFDEHLRPELEQRITEIYRRVGLDYFGIDCALNAAGDLVIFEVNATMNMLVDIKLQPDLWSAATEKIKTALLQLIDDHSQWVVSSPRQGAVAKGSASSNEEAASAFESQS